MQLKYESFIIWYITLWWIFFESTSAKYIIMLTFDNVESRSLIYNKFSEISIRKVLFWPSEEHSQLEVFAVKPSFEFLPVFLNICDQT